MPVGRFLYVSSFCPFSKMMNMYKYVCKCVVNMLVFGHLLILRELFQFFFCASPGLMGGAPFLAEPAERTNSAEAREESAADMTHGYAGFFNIFFVLAAVQFPDFGCLLEMLFLRLA